MALRKVVVIAGPTASGKSQLAVDVARSCRGVVVNADSMQVYPDTPVLSAIPSAAERGGIEHCLYGVFPSSKNGTVVEWLVLAAGEIRRIWSEGKLPVVCGGTGLYIDNLINGTTPIPEAEPEVRHKVAEAAAAEGIPALHARLSTVDAVTADRLNPNDSTKSQKGAGGFLSDWRTVVGLASAANGSEIAGSRICHVENFCRRWQNWTSVVSGVLTR